MEMRAAQWLNRAGEPAGQGEDVLGQFGRVEYIELGAENSYVDGEHVGGFGAGVQDAGVFAVGLEVADGGRETFGGCLGREVQPDAGLVTVGRGGHRAGYVGGGVAAGRVARGESWPGDLR